MLSTNKIKIHPTLLFLSLCATTTFSQTPKLTISPLTDHFYIYTTSKTYPDTPPVSIPANGMYWVTDQGVALFDTPFDTTQFQPLLDSILVRHHQKVVLCIATHSHDDRSAGLEYYTSKGIRTYTTQQTDEFSKKRHEKRAAHLMYQDTVFTIGREHFQTFYPGAGHTSDNIVIWFEREKILYGGCFIKSTESKDLGNLKDANVPEWSRSIKRVQHKFGKPRYIIPGHFSWENRRALKHTLKLTRKYKRENHLR